MAILGKGEELKEKADEKIEEWKNKYQEYKHTLVGYTQKNPISALALAVTAGILLGSFWRAMHCKK